MSRRPFAAALALVAAGVLFAPGLAAQQYTFDSWDESHGLPQSSVQAVAQGGDGYLWIGTMGGLARFDGAHFRIFDRRNVPQLSDNVVQTLLADENRLWIGMGSGSILLHEGGKFRAFPMAGDRRAISIWDFELDDQGRLWAATQAGLAVRDGDEFRLAFPSHPLLSGSILSLHRGRNGVLWAGSDQPALIRIDGQRIDVFGPAQGLPAGAVRAILEEPEGHVWVGTESALAHFDGARFRTITTGEGLVSNVVRALLLDRGGDLWVGTYGGLSRRVGEGFENFKNESLPSEMVRTLIEDREGNLWAGTGGGGLVRVRHSQIRTISQPEGLASGFARSVFQSSDGAMWIGTFGGGLHRLRGSSIRRFTMADGLPDDVAFSIAETPDGAIWTGTRAGVARIEGDRVTRVIGVREGLPEATVRALYTAKDGALWMGTLAGAVRWDGTKLERFGTERGLSHPAVFYITETSDGALWMATHGGGLNRWKDGKVRVFGVAEGLPTPRVWSIFEDGEGSIWIGTRGAGLVRYRDGRFVTVNTEHGLFDDTVYHVIGDSAGRLWMSGNKGIFAASIRDLNAFCDRRQPFVPMLTFGKSEGMRSPECNGASQPAGWRANDGSIWFPTLDGVAIVDPASMNATVGLPAVRLESIAVNGQQLPLARSMRIGPGANRLQIGYTGLLLSAPERLEFRYRLEPLDEEWVDAGSSRVAFYTNLEPGAYRFRVAAAARGGPYAREETIALHIAPELWETRSFWAAVAALALLAVAGVFVIRSGRARRRERELRGLVDQRTQELELANERLREQTREDPLTGLANRRYFDETFELEWRRAMRDAAWLSLILLDVDHFKDYNDLYGHQSGDECLRNLAGILRSVGHRPGDLVARYGGEEFAVILYGAEPLHVARIAEDLRLAVERNGCEHAASSVASVLTISAGAASVKPHSGLRPDQLVAAADDLLYEAKRGGRNNTRAGILGGGTIQRLAL